MMDNIDKMPPERRIRIAKRAAVLAVQLADKHDKPVSARVRYIAETPEEQLLAQLKESLMDNVDKILTNVYDPREAKLPVWAREQLSAARSEAARAKEKLAAHLATVEPTRMWYGDYGNPIYIPNHYGHQRVYFQLAPRTETSSSYDEVQVGIVPTSNNEGLALEIMAGHAIVIEPQVSNVVRVWFRD